MQRTRSTATSPTSPPTEPLGPGAAVFRPAGFKCLRAATTTDDHDRCLQRVGFTRFNDARSDFELALWPRPPAVCS